jgi:hypothetical protein
VANKRPHTINGFKDATTDEARVRAFWNQYPNALVGVPTGRAVSALVIDVDVKNEHRGDLTLDALEAKLGPLPETLKMRTKSGGTHLYFELPDGEFRSTAGLLGDGIDTRADGGYVIAAGAGYERVETGVDIPEELPLAWIAHLRAPPSRAAVQRDTGGVIAAGNRNDTLTSPAGTLRKRGVGHEGLRQALLALNAAECSPPLDDAEVDKIAKWVARYKPDTPLAAPVELLATESFDQLARSAAPPEYLVEGILEVAQAAMLAGNRGTGKTFIALDLAAHIAAGRDWFGRATSGCKVLYFSGEGARGFRRRTAVFGTNRFSPGDNFQAYLGVLSLGAGKHDEARVSADVRRIVQFVERERPGLLVIDTVSRYKGNVEENDNTAVAEFLAILQRELSERYALAILLVAHTPKDEKLTVRGAGAWEANTDVLLTLEKNQFGAYELNVPRVRDGEQAAPLEFRLEKGWAGSRIQSMVIRPMTADDIAAQEIAADNAREMRCSEIRERIANAVREQGTWSSTHAIWDALGAQTKGHNGPDSLHQRAVREYLETMAKEGQIQRREGRSANSQPRAEYWSNVDHHHTKNA